MRILDITGCHPHDTQQLACFVWSRDYLQQIPVTSAVVDQAFQRVLEVENDRFATLWEGLPRSQRQVLKALASTGDKGIYSEEYRIQHGLGAPTTVQGALAALRKKDLVESTEEGYAIADRLLSAWLLRYRTGPEPEVRISTSPPEAMPSEPRIHAVGGKLW
ncbi:MAG: hypothetical protein HYX94_02255 [Chloroflexi bacterium]|nr:hypothetical protein [Chloroflexota bacterium]